jgi:exopolysaccharide biosynthesis polyprenyl glycosylphosphotransferase
VTNEPTRRNDVLIPALGVLFDVLSIEASFLLAYYLRFNTAVMSFLPLTEDTPPLGAYLNASAVILPVWLLLFQSRGMYGARRNTALADEFFQIVRLVTLGMLLVMSAAFFYRAFSFSRAVVVLLWGTSIAGVFLGRFCLRRVEIALYRTGRGLRNAVIVGSNETAGRIYQLLHGHPLLGYRICGYLADAPAAAEGPLAGSPHLGTLGDVPARLASERIELALIALPYAEHPKLYALVQECEGVNVEFMMVPDVLELLAANMKMKEIEGIPFIRLKGNPMTAWGAITKRAFDGAVSLLLLGAASPVFLAAALAVRLSSPGPVLFRQERLGLDGKRFLMVKFRTMVAGAEQQDRQAGLGIPDDPRQTRVGRFLRRTSIDELPQLLNVLKGEMSLVGPRPERPYFVEQFKDQIPKYLDRHRVKTGMTGWAQVNGLRGNSSLEERIRYDVYYIENWSLGFDLKILLKTIGALVRHA